MFSCSMPVGRRILFEYMIYVNVLCILKKLVSRILVLGVLWAGEIRSIFLSMFFGTGISRVGFFVTLVLICCRDFWFG